LCGYKLLGRNLPLVLSKPTEQGLPPALNTQERDVPLGIAALIDSYLKSGQFTALRETSKAGYQSRLATMRENHGHRLVSAMTRDRIKTFVLDPLANKPGACLDTLKKLRILIKHAIDKGWLKNDPSAGIKRAKTKEIRAWTDDELEAFKRKWPLGTKQRAAAESES
jgi:hypothetical protein